MRLRLRWLGAGLLALLLGGCQPGAPPPGPPVVAPAVAAQFGRLLRQGDSLYAQKQGYGSLLRAQHYFDSARTLADRAGDTLLLAEAVFAKARVYDAWNQAPRKTLAYFQQAAALFAHRPAAWRRYFYARYLVAHAYDKIPDSLRTVQELRRLRAELLARPAWARQQVPSTVEMALTATQVRNYALADSLLRQLVHRAAVRNDPQTYDYLDHFYLTQARLAVYLQQAPYSPYLDSLAQIHAQARNPFDQLYYGHNLAELYAASGQFGRAYAYLRRSARLQDSLRDDANVPRLRQSLVLSEERAARREQQLEAARERTRTRSLWGLGLGLAVISTLSLYLYRQQRVLRRQARALTQTNQQLDQQVAQVELLNKEIQHRVKNNLHMVYSLLHLQERRTDNEQVQQHLQAARLRVESIAALHNQLLLAPDHPDLAAYLRALIATAVQCLAGGSRQVVTHLQTAPLRLPPPAYLPLSLILNEWVTNSIKYADTGEQLLEISVHVRPASDGGALCLDYHDSGRPPAPGQPPPRPGLGSQIINLLTRQLGATLQTLPGQPFHYELCLPAPLAHGAAPAENLAARR